MAFLIVLGNLNQHTFANTLVVANHKAKEIMNEPLSSIFVIHSEDSERELAKAGAWKEKIQDAGIDVKEIQGKVINLTGGGKDAISKFVRHIIFLFKGIGLEHSDKWMVDLTNGTSVQKNLLSISSYILNIRHQFMIDMSILNSLTQDRGFLDVDILSKCYQPAPDSTQMDEFAYLDLSVMTRYKQLVDNQTQQFKNTFQIDEINRKADENFFKQNLLHSIQLKLEADKNRDNAKYRIATAAISASLEEMVSELLRDQRGMEKATLGRKLKMLQEQIANEHPGDFDIAFFEKFNEFMLYLRNSATHKKTNLNDVERFKADLALRMSFPFLQFYLDIVAPAVKQSKSNKASKIVSKKKELIIISAPNIRAEDNYYFGLDGDNTGVFLEGLFVSSSTGEAEFKKFSKKIKVAIDDIAKEIKRLHGVIIFEAGDDLLFRGAFSAEKLMEFQQMYAQKTDGCTCSISFGKTLHENYLAMKLAKTYPGKNTILGIEMRKNADA